MACYRADQALCRCRRGRKLAANSCVQRIASAAQHADLRTELLERAQRAAARCAGHLPKDELVKLQQRLAALETIIAAEG
jgi:hypothetical protein